MLALHFGDMPLQQPGLSLRRAGGADPSVRVEAVGPVESKFEPIQFELSASYPAASVWLETPYAGRWSDNAMYVTEGKRSIAFYPWEPVAADDVLRTTSVWSVNNL